MKKTFLAFIILLLTLPAFAKDIIYTCNGQRIKFTTTGPKTCEIAENPDIHGPVDILPGFYYNMVYYRVTSVGYKAFCGCSRIWYVTLPNTIESIGDRAFEGCSNMTFFNMPNSVQKVGEYAFKKCLNLETLHLSTALTSIGKQAFYNCYKLTSINLPSTLSTIDNEAFIFCSGLTSMEIPSSVTSMGSNVFKECTNLSKVTLGSSLQSFDQSIFNGCTKLNDITSLAENPPLITKKESASDLTNCNLYVPQESMEAYQKADWWNKFTAIYDMATSSPNIAGTAQFVEVKHGNIIISNAEIGSRITVHDINGAMVATAKITDATQSIPVNRNGLFIVRVNNTCRKLIL